MEFKCSDTSNEHSKVSIQLLFRWNYLYDYFTFTCMGRFQYNCCFGGIRWLWKCNLWFYKFQYNCCFGGITRPVKSQAEQLSFNTTVVSVEYNKLNSFVKRLFVSIQLLFRWNPSSTAFCKVCWTFQYNCCFGGINALGAGFCKEIKVSIQLLFRWNRC